MTIFLDFDGTVVEHEFPKMGRCNFGFVEVVRKLQDAGHRIVLNTYRVECKDGTWEVAIDYLNKQSWRMSKNRETELRPIDSSTASKYNPHPWDWEQIEKTKVMYIDDVAEGIPLKRCVMIPGMMVDWDELDKQFTEHGTYNKIEG